MEIVNSLPFTFLVDSLRAIALLLLYLFHKARYDPVVQCICYRVLWRPPVNMVRICSRTGITVATQCFTCINESSSEAGYLAQVKFHAILHFKIKDITLRWNCIMICESISLDRGRQKLSPFNFILLGRHAINLLSWALFLPRQLLDHLYACFTLNSCVFADIMATFRTLRMFCAEACTCLVEMAVLMHPRIIFTFFPPQLYHNSHN